MCGQHPSPCANPRQLTPCIAPPALLLLQFRRPHVVVATKYYFDRHVQHAATLRQQRIPLYGTYIEDFEAPRVNTPEEWNTISVALRQPLHAHSTKAFTRPVYRPTSATYGSRPPIDNMKKALEGEELLKSLLAQSQTLASSTVLATQQ